MVNPHRDENHFGCGTVGFGGGIFSACSRRRRKKPRPAMNGATTLTIFGGNSACRSGFASQTVGKIASAAKTHVECQRHQLRASETSFMRPPWSASGRRDVAR